MPFATTFDHRLLASRVLLFVRYVSVIVRVRMLLESLKGILVVESLGCQLGVSFVVQSHCSLFN